jgi:hypothetical protein
LKLALQGILFASYKKIRSMKKLMLLLVAVIGITFAANAQINVSINIGSQPGWGPTGYDHVDYYYMPDLEVYYSVPDGLYWYNDGRNWVSARTLPARFGKVDLYSVHKVVINGVDKPYLQHEKYRKEYVKFKGKRDQVAIRDSKEEKYFESKDHPRHNDWVKGHPNGRDDHHDDHKH